MAYNVKYTDTNKTPIVVDETAVNTTDTDIDLLGRVKLEYGEELNETLLHVLENFACPSDPSDINVPDFSRTVDNKLENPIGGQLWFNTTTNSLHVYDEGLAEWIKFGSDAGIGGNKGQIAHGDRIPLPFTNGTLNYSNCTMVVSPAIVSSKYDYLACTVDQQGFVTMLYRPVGSTEIVEGIANYMILGIVGHSNDGIYVPVPDPIGVTPTPSPTSSPTPTSSVTPTTSPTPTPTPTPSGDVTPTPTPSPTVTPTVTPSPSDDPTGDVIDGLFLSAVSGSSKPAAVTLNSTGTYQEDWYPNQSDTGPYIVGSPPLANASSYTFTVVALNGTVCGPTSGNLGDSPQWAIGGGSGTCSVRVDITAPSGSQSGQIFIDVTSSSSGGGGTIDDGSGDDVAIK